MHPVRPARAARWLKTFTTLTTNDSPKNQAGHDFRARGKSSKRLRLWELEDRTVPAGADNFADATMITATPYTDTGDSTDYTGEAGEPNHEGGAGPIHSAWWRWVAPSSTTINLNTAGSEFNTSLAVYIGPSLGNLIFINGATISNVSQFSFHAEAGMTYHIALDGPGHNRGLYQLNFGFANVAPTLTADNTAVTAPEGSTVTNSGTISDPNGDFIALSASVGSVTNNLNGTWSWSHPANDGPAGPTTVTITGNDGLGGLSTTTFTYSVTNLPPTINTYNVPTTGSEGSPLVLSAAATDPAGSFDPLTYLWTITGPGIVGTLNLSGANTSFTPNDNGLYNVSLLVNDGDGGVDTRSSTIAVGNLAPTIITYNVPATGNEGSSLNLSASATDPAGSFDPLTYTWTITGPAIVGSLILSGPSVNFTPGDNGPFNVSLLVSDSDTGTATRNSTILVGNLPPTIVTYSVPTTGSEGSSITLSAAATDPAGVNDPLTYTWTITGPTILGSLTLSGPSVSFTPGDNGLFSVSLVVSDGDGGAATRNSNINVGNLNPTITNFNVPPFGAEGYAATVSATATDPAGVNDPLTYTWTITGPGIAGSLVQTGATTSFVPSTAGTYNLALLVTDGDGGSAARAASMNVVVVSSSLSLSGAATTSEGATYHLTISGVTSPPLTGMSISWGDGISTLTSAELNTLVTTGTVTVTHAFTDGGPTPGTTYTIAATAQTSFFSFTPITKNVVVTNVAPTASVSNTLPPPIVGSTIPVIVRHSPHDFTLSNIVDPAQSHDSYTLLWDWNYTGPSDTTFDASASVAYGAAPQTKTFAYTSTGIKHLRFRVMDEDGGVTDYFQDLEVRTVVQQLNGDLHISGTDQDNLFQYDPGATPASIRVIVDFAFLGTFTLPPGSLVRTFAGGGTDTVTIIGTLNADQFELSEDVVRNNDRDKEILFNGVVYSTLDAEIYSLKGSEGADTFIVRGLGLTSAPSTRNVTLIGENGTDNLISFLPDWAVAGGLTTGNDWTIEGPQRGKLEGFLNFSLMDSLTGNELDDNFVYSSGASMPGILAGVTGANRVDLSAVLTSVNITAQTSGALVSPVGTLTGVTTLIGTNSSSPDKLIGANQANIWNVTGPNTVTYLSGANLPINFSSIESLTGGTATDTFNMPAAASLSGSLDGGLGIDKLDYSTRTTNVSVGVTPATATSVAGTWAGLESIIAGSGATNTLTGGNVANTWMLTGVNDGTLGTLSFTDFGTLNGGTSTDAFILGVSGQANAIAGGTGTDTLSYAGAGSAVGVTLTAANNGSGTRVASFTGIDSFIGGTGSDTFTAANVNNAFVVNAAKAGTLNTAMSFNNFENLVGGSATDTFAITTLVANPLTSLNGLGGTNTLTAANSTNAFVLTGAGSGTLNGVGFANITNLTGGSGADSMNFSSGSIAGTANGGSGTDTLTIGAGTVNIATLTATGVGTTYASFESFVSTAGGTLSGPNTSNTWRLTGLNMGTLNTTITFNGFANINGGTAADRLMFQTGGLSGTFNGGLGTDILDYIGVLTIPRPYTPTFLGLLVNVLDGLGSGHMTMINSFEQIVNNL